MISRKNIYKLGLRSKILLGIAFLSIIISFLAPYFFTKFSWIDFTKTGQIGDTLGGIMNPFIAIGGVLLTYLAFYMQFKANQLQRQQFEIQLEEDKNQFKLERKEQEKQFTKNHFENQFYEMVRLHKENVNEIELEIKKETFHNGNKHIEKTQIKGREAFTHFMEELKIIYYVAKKAFSNKDKDFLMNKAYSIFFHSMIIYHSNLPNKKDDPETYSLLVNLISIRDKFKDNPTEYQKHINEDCKEYFSKGQLKHHLFGGYSSYLAHYYRHLYQTVKFIVSQKEEMLSYSQKRNYLRILRSQLSNQEQAMLFYNWKSEFGKNWENKKQNYFTDYRMIHNLYDDILINDFKLEEVFDIKNLNYLKEENRENDNLFEFQDW